MIPVLTKADVEPHLDWITLIDAIEAAHRRPPAQIHDALLGRGDDKLLSRAAWIDGVGIGVKSVTAFAGNAARGLPTVQGAMLVFDDETGALRAAIESDLITKWKTAGDSILGARFLARPEARRLLIIGAGTVAASLIEAYSALIPDLEPTVWARRPEAAQALTARYPGARVASDLQRAVEDAEIIATCTLAREPIIMGDWLRPGQHLDLIGAFTPDMREADDTALRRARIFVDCRETTLSHIGELKIPLAAGVITPADVLGDFHDMAMQRAGRQSNEEITLFKNGGGAHLDLMTADVVLDAWKRGPTPNG